ncbi:MAG: OadG family protein [Pseudomonadales bacterium]
MLESEIVTQGVSLMQFGMGTVFLFLALLVLMTKLMSLLVARFEPKPAELSSSAVVSTGTPLAGQPVEDPEVLAVIAAAIQAHRNR